MLIDMFVLSLGDILWFVDVFCVADTVSLLTCLYCHSEIFCGCLFLHDMFVKGVVKFYWVFA
jgi:hypothetical protein